MSTVISRRRSRRSEITHSREAVIIAGRAMERFQGDAWAPSDRIVHRHLDHLARVDSVLYAQVVSWMAHQYKRIPAVDAQEAEIALQVWRGCVEERWVVSNAAYVLRNGYAHCMTTVTGRRPIAKASTQIAQGWQAARPLPLFSLEGAVA